MIQLHHGDCLEVMRSIPDGSIDLVLADLPYGTTKCKWDTIIPFEPLWAAYKRVLKPRGAVVLTACQPFTSSLVMSNPKWFRYEDIWEKTCPSGHLDVHRRPMRRHESILLFSPTGKRTYNPQMGSGVPYTSKTGPQSSIYGTHHRVVTVNKGDRYPTSLARFPNCRHRGGHPTQKPVALMEYLIRTYSIEGETVLDNTMGSGTTGVACIRTGRSFIGIEKDEGYFAIAEHRIADELAKTSLIGGAT